MSRKLPKISSLEEYFSAHQQSLKSTDQYWSKIAENFKWHQPFNSVVNGSLEQQNISWFTNGKLNMSENCLDVHLSDKSNKTALIFIPNDPKEKAQKITYQELTIKVSQFSNLLKDQGVKKGDRVCFYMGMVPELLIGILAATRIGAIHSVVFGGFSAKALRERIIDCDAKILITSDVSLRGDKIIGLKEIADEALKESTPVTKVLVHKRGEKDYPLKKDRDIELNSLLTNMPKDCPPEIMDSEDPLFILYTSGSTGRPKGLFHTTAGYMVYAAHSFQNVFQMDEDDIYWCTADIGWITGHTYLTYGPLLNGLTTTMFEGVPTYPDGGRFWQEVDRHKITHFYTAPTAIRALEAMSSELVTKHDLSSLKVLGTVGEPINLEAWQWYNEKVGKKKCPIVDTWWQTETGGIMISPLAGITPLIPCSATYPLPGIEPVLMDADGKEIKELKAEGNLCIKKPWPGMARGVWGDKERYKETYFKTYPGHYFTGDGAKRDEKGNYRITGRVDDVINVSGHRIGTAEVEDAINQHDKIVESAVVGHTHPIKGQGIYAFVTLFKQSKDLSDQDYQAIKKELEQLVKKEIGAIARPDVIHLAPALPKTRSGKIMRRILRKIANNELDNFGDTSTLLNPDIVDVLIKTRPDN